MSLEIVTIDSPKKGVLRQKTKPFGQNELHQAREIADQLIETLEPLMPAAGLAAPQIGISRSIFIYSYDRTLEHLKVVINPSFEPVGDEVVEGWEGCFSAIFSNGTWQMARLPRYEKIKATYLNLDGMEEVVMLEGFSAKVFQHEYDHLQGIACVLREDATVKTFESEEELKGFMQSVKERGCCSV